MHREIFLLVFVASVLPATLITFSLYYLIFGVTAEQIAIPEFIAYNLIPASRRVFYILLFASPFSILAILILAYKLTHKIVGPFDRIVRELDERVQGKKTGHIILRKKDKFHPLVKGINKLLDKLR